MNRNSVMSLDERSAQSCDQPAMEREINFFQAVGIALQESLMDYFEDFGERLLSDQLTVKECLRLFIAGGLAAQIFILLAKLL